MAASKTFICVGNPSSVSITTASSQADLKYWLRDNSDNSIIDGPKDGTAASLSFNTGIISSNKDYNVYALEKSTYLHFDGNSQDVALNDATGIPVGNESFTIEAWFKPEVFNSGGIIGWGNYGNLSEVNALRLDGSTTVLHHYFWNNDLTVTVPDMSDDNWHHVAVTYDGTARIIYFDGVNVGTDNPVGVNVGPATNLTIGKTYNTEYLTGGIADVRIWNIARSEAEINTDKDASLTGTESGLVAYYTFEDSKNSNTLTDLAGGDNTGTLENMDAAAVWYPNADFQMSGIISIAAKTESSSLLTKTACGSFTLNGQTYTSSNTYTQIITNAAGCDSTITLNLTINNVNSNVTQNGTTLTADAASATYQWVDCNDNYSHLNLETNQGFTASTSGSYAVIVTENSCSDTSSCYAIVISGINSMSSGNKISIYPSPAESNLNIEINSASNEEAEISLVNALGTQVYSEKVLLTSGTNTKQMNVEKFIRGAYFLKVIQNDKVSTEKLILK